MSRLSTTRAQREAVLRLFKRHYWDDLSPSQRDSLAPQHYFPTKAWRRLYRQYRRRFQLAGFAGDYYLFGQPYDQGEGQLWVGIETDGYTHS